MNYYFVHLEWRGKPRWSVGWSFIHHRFGDRL